MIAEYRTVPSFVTLASNVWTQIVPNNPRRNVLLITQRSSDEIIVSPVRDDDMTPQGWPINLHGGIILLDQRNHSILPTIAWYGHHVALADRRVLVVECMERG